MIVGKHEIESATVKKIVAYSESRIDDLRRLNDGDMDAVKTAYTRGAIAEMKKLLKGLSEAQPLKAAAENRNPYA